MKRPKLALQTAWPVAALATTLATPHVAHASYWASIKARPVEVKFTPNAQAPTKITITGVFAIATSAVYPGYTAPKCGRIEYTCPVGKEAMCQLEWADIAKAVSNGTCVSYGGRNDLATLDSLKVWPLDQPVGAAPPYDPSMGVSNPPCDPGAPDPGRPLLTAACGSTSDAGAPDANKPADASGPDAKPNDAGAGGATAGAGGATAGAPGGSTAGGPGTGPAAGAAGSTQPPATGGHAGTPAVAGTTGSAAGAMGSSGSSGCSVGGSGSGLLALLGAAGLLSARRRWRRS